MLSFPEKTFNEPTHLPCFRLFATRRTRFCAINPPNGGVMPHPDGPSACDGLDKQPRRRACFEKPCASADHLWKPTGMYSECTKRCGGGEM